MFHGALWLGPTKWGGLVYGSRTSEQFNVSGGIYMTMNLSYDHMHGAGRKDPLSSGYGLRKMCSFRDDSVTVNDTG